MEFVFLREIIDEMDLEIINESTNIDDVKIYSSELSRPGLQLVGFYEKFVPERLQVIGSAEWHYLEELSPDERYNSLDNFLSHPISALIISRDLPIFPEIYEIAQKHNRNVLKSKEITSKLFNKIISYVDLQLSLETRMHGVLVEVYGVGILIIGKSGVGKSETALDLVIRGHRLVSDDTVIIKRIDDMLQGKSPELTRHFMEIRGLGILDIERLYGVGSVKNDEFIEMVIELELWDDSREYDRIGLDETYTEILGIPVSTSVVPVRPGRNVAMIIEVAARNFRQKALGYNAANELNEKIMKQIEINKSNKEKEQGN
ncbi:MAG TPA: HPr(Ser) kinase/phosphatase [Tissierellaceae bacterium]|nr:HPr(Ser) kinase/phosphatase [Tissierellaceae bacterium]